MTQTERNLDDRPYSADEQRIAEFFFEYGVGGGDDPVGSILASYTFLAAKRSQDIQALRDIISIARDAQATDALGDIVGRAEEELAK